MDLLIKLYTLPAAAARPLTNGIAIRKPLGPEHDLLPDWVAQHFGPGWASEARVALSHRPVTLFVATQNGAPIGFACYDATARGLFGPFGVAPEARGAGVGEALLLATLHDMRAAGYGYAVAGHVGPTRLFKQVVGATEIAGSEPGLYQGLLHPPHLPG